MKHCTHTQIEIDFFHKKGDGSKIQDTNVFRRHASSITVYYSGLVVY